MPGRRPMRWLLGLAGCQFVGYGLLWLLLHVPNIVPPVSNGWFRFDSGYGQAVARNPVVTWLANHATIAGTLLLLTFLVVSLTFLVAVTITWRTRLRLGTGLLVTLTALMALPLLVLPQLLSSDVYSYAIYGRIPALHGGNPLIDIPADFPGDPLLSSVAWKTTTSVYGPAWIMVSIAVTALAELLGGSAGIYVLLYKLLGLACHLGSVVLISRLLERVRPSAASWGAVAYAWHPLILIEFVGSGHNDSLMLLLIFLGLMAATRQQRSLALGLLTVAGMVKLVAIFLVPLYVLWVLWQTDPRRRLATVVRQALLGVAVVAGLYLPFWAGPATITTLAASPPLTILHQSPASWIHTKLSALVCSGAGATPEQPQPGPDGCTVQLADAVRLSSVLLFGVAYLLLLCRPIRTFDSLIGRSVATLIAYNLLAAVHYEPWYGTWVVGLAPLLRRPRPILLSWGCALLVLHGTLILRGRILLAFVPLLVLALDELRRTDWVRQRLPLRMSALAGGERATDRT